MKRRERKRSGGTGIIRQALGQWRLVLHLLLGTPRFGVNNVSRARFDSLFSRPLFGFGYGALLKPWSWCGIAKVIRLRAQIAGWGRR